MSEPKTVATDLLELAPGLFHFKIDDERIRSQSDAYALVREGRAVLIDPIPLAPAALERLGRIEAVVIGTPSHQRSAWRYRRERDAKVYAPEESDGLEEKPDVTYRAGDALPLGLKPLHAPGPAPAHHAFLVDSGPGVLLCTDLWHVGKGGVEFLPDKYMKDPEQARRSARLLMEMSFDILGLGHGDPIRKDARRAVARVVETDAKAREKR